ncbi:glycosyltransferase family 4 protein [Halocatena halophila]|uniref:glycosyltransferase family 4 protein n=1 Tax=Halocatena halophila TaxID=2814576 RepID=UPI002ED1859D
MTADQLLIVGTLGGGGIHRYVEQQRQNIEQVETTVYDMASDPKGEGLLWLLSSTLRSLWAAIKFPFRTPPDVVHVHTSHQFSFYRAAFYVLYGNYVWNRPVVLHVHGSSFDSFVTTDSPAVRRIQDLVFDACDRVIVLSPYWKEVLSSRVSDSKLRVLPNAIDPTVYSPNYTAEPQHVVFVSNLVERKGIRELVTAVDELLSGETAVSELRVSIAGTGPLTNIVEELAEKHEQVTYHGYVSEERKRSLLDSGSVFVLPAYAEGLPIALLEGMAGGNAVISTTVGSIPEVIDAENGLLVTPENATELSDALSTLLVDPERTEEMARTNRRMVSQTYSWDVAERTLRKIYAELPA